MADVFLFFVKVNIFSEVKIDEHVNNAQSQDLYGDQDWRMNWSTTSFWALSTEFIDFQQNHWIICTITKKNVFKDLFRHALLNILATNP